MLLLMSLSMFDPMTSTVPRRLFDDFVDDQPMETYSKEADLKANGMIRANGIIPIEYNDRLKAMARKQGKNADQLIGELLLEMRPALDKWEAQQEAARLRDRFGDNWMEVLQQAG
jgi:hypothetical protein